MKTAKKRPPRVAPLSGQCSGLASRTIAKLLYHIRPKTQALIQPGREVPSVSGVELVFVTIGVGWLVGRGFRVVEAIDRKESKRHG